MGRLSLVSALLLGVAGVFIGGGEARGQARPPFEDVARPPVDEGGGTPDLQAHPLDEDRAWRPAAQRRLEANLRRLARAGRLPPLPLARDQAPVLLAWPLRDARGEVASLHARGGHVDHDPAYPDALRDYRCGARTYDTAGGYNHAGTDFLLWPFPWRTMDEERAEVIAAAPGVIALREDGHYDRQCAAGGQRANMVFVRHADGTVAWYLHLKQGSLTPKAVGDSVEAGERLGLVGSSGSSTTPHLHLELRDSQGGLLDPFAGPCNPTTSVSRWQVQPPYDDPALNRLHAAAAPPESAPCPQPGQPHQRDVFRHGERLYAIAYYRDLLPGARTDLRLRRPDGSLYRAWSADVPSGALRAAASYRYWAHDLPLSGAEGVWRLEADFGGATQATTFRLGDGPPPSLTPPATATADSTSAATSAPSASATASATRAPRPSPSPSPLASASATSSPTSTPSPSVTPSPTPTPTSTSTPRASGTPPPTRPAASPPPSPPGGWTDRAWLPVSLRWTERP